MTEEEICACVIQPFQVNKIMKLLQKETTIGELLKIFTRDMGISDFWEDYRERLLTALYAAQEWHDRYDKEHLRAINAENQLKDAENVFKIIEQNMNSYKQIYQK